MARLVTLGEPHLDREPPTVATQATTWSEATLALVKLQAVGLTVPPTRQGMLLMKLMSVYL